MRSGGVAGAADSTDPLAGDYPAMGDQHLGQVAVPGLGAVPVPHRDPPAVGAGPPGLNDLTSGDRADCGADRCGEVQPGVDSGPQAATSAEARGELVVVGR